MTYKEIIDTLLSAKLENGKMVVRKLEDREGMGRIRDFDLEKDWIEQKEVTKMGKIIGAYLLKVYPDLLPQNNPAYLGYTIYSSDFTPASLKSAYTGYWPPYGDTVRENRKSRAIYKNAEERAGQLMPIADHFEALKKRSLRNGRFPKEEMDKRKTEVIKGKLDPDLNREIMRLRDKWYPIIYTHSLDFWKARREAAILFLDQMKWEDPVRPKSGSEKAMEKYQSHLDTLFLFLGENVIERGSKLEGRSYSPAADGVLEGKAKRAAEQESKAFYFKMADKLGGFVTDIGKSLKSVQDSDEGGPSPFESSIRFTFTDGSNFLLRNSIVASESSLGTFYFRYPATFHDAYNARGEKLKNPDEYGVKAAFLEDVKGKSQKR